CRLAFLISLGQLRFLLSNHLRAVNQREAIRAMRSQKSEGGRVFAATAPGAIDLAPRPGSADPVSHKGAPMRVYSSVCRRIAGFHYASSNRARYAHVENSSTATHSARSKKQIFDVKI